MSSLLKRYLLPFGVSTALVIFIDILTNGITIKLLFDSNVYIGMAEAGFAPELRISPFVYRYAGPFLAGGIQEFIGLSIYESFKALTYLGATCTLFGVFLLVHDLTKSGKSAYSGMLSVAFSLYNIKYALFDVYRPDILAYPIILFGTWLAFKDSFFPLLLTTMIGLQFREFTIAPLLAYLAAKLQHEMSRMTIIHAVISALGLLLAIGLPRMLIPAIEHAEAVQLSPAGFGQAIQLLSMSARDINIVYIVLAYFLPFLILYRPPRFSSVLKDVAIERASCLAYYSAIVLILLIIGGTDLERFATHFFLPLAVLTGLLAKDQPSNRILLVLAIQFIFNRIWLPFPVWDFDLMVNFYAGWSNVINTASRWRFAELIALAIIGNFLVHFRFSSNEKTPLESGE